MAVSVPAGEHEVRLSFVSRTVETGLAVTAASFLLLFAYLLRAVVNVFRAGIRIELER